MTLKPEATIYLEKARKAYRAARVLQKEILWEDAFSRAYYAVLNLAKAILTNANLEVPKTHSGLVATLWINRQKLEILDKIIQNISRHQALREEGDYGLITSVTQEDLEKIFSDIKLLFEHLGEKDEE